MAVALTPEGEQIACMLETAARILRRGDKPHLDSVAWRVADASGLLRLMIERAGLAGQGVSSPTGRGCLLSTVPQSLRNHRNHGETTAETIGKNMVSKGV